MNNYFCVVVSMEEGKEDRLLHVLSCTRHAIRRYIESLRFDSEVKILFFPLDKLNERDIISLTYIDRERYEEIELTNAKSLLHFLNEVDAVMDSLDIKEVEVKKNNE